MWASCSGFLVRCRIVKKKWVVIFMEQSMHQANVTSKLWYSHGIFSTWTGKTPIFSSLKLTFSIKIAFEDDFPFPVWWNILVSREGRIINSPSLKVVPDFWGGLRFGKIESSPNHRRLPTNPPTERPSLPTEDNEELVNGTPVSSYKTLGRNQTSKGCWFKKGLIDLPALWTETKGVKMQQKTTVFTDHPLIWIKYWAG